MKSNTLRYLFVEELRDLYDAENRLVKALPKMAKAADSDELRSGFEEHLEQTKGHVERLKEVLTSLGEKVSAKKCAGMAGIVKEGEEMLDEDFEGAVKDAALISAAQRVEHYEIGAYGCVRTWAEILGEDSAAELLRKTLEEEKETDSKLSDLAEKINVEANAGQESGGEEGDEDSEEAQPSAARHGNGRAKSRATRA
jgi:ferritin-like metal-binding protein YciE